MSIVTFGARPAAHDPITTKVTFTREIAAILGARCASCHAAQRSAPMRLTTYEDVRPWARAIKDQILTRRMPKWHAARGFGAFANDPSLTPFEQALVVAWVDGGMPKGAGGAGGAGARGPEGARGDAAVVVAARGTRGVSVSRAARWVTGWTFEPGDPLITRAIISSTAGAIGTWVAGDQRVMLPAGSAIRAMGRITVQVQRRARADYEQPFTSRPSVLRVSERAQRPSRHVWVETIACGKAVTRPGELLAVAPRLAAGASARIWLARPGAAAAMIGWFRDAEPAFARTYWLARPLDLSLDSRVQSDVPCQIELTLTR